MNGFQVQSNIQPIIHAQLYGKQQLQYLQNKNQWTREQCRDIDWDSIKTAPKKYSLNKYISIQKSKYHGRLQVKRTIKFTIQMNLQNALDAQLNLKPIIILCSVKNGIIKR